MNTRPPHDDPSAASADESAGEIRAAGAPDRAACAFAGQVAALHDGELPPERRQVVEAHLGDCPDCRNELSRLRRLSQLLGGGAAALDALDEGRIEQALGRALNRIKQSKLTRGTFAQTAPADEVSQPREARLARAPQAADAVYPRLASAGTARPEAGTRAGVAPAAPEVIPPSVLRLVRRMTAAAAAVLVGGLVVLYRQGTQPATTGPDPAPLSVLWEKNASVAPDGAPADAATAENSQLRFAQWIVNDLSPGSGLPSGPSVEQQK